MNLEMTSLLEMAATHGGFSQWFSMNLSLSGCFVSNARLRMRHSKSLLVLCVSVLSLCSFCGDDGTVGCTEIACRKCTYI